MQVNQNGQPHHWRGAVQPESAAKKASVNRDQRLFLLRRQRIVQPNRFFDRARRLSLLVQQAGACIERLGRDLESVSQALEHMGRRRVHPPLNLTEVGVRHVGQLGKLAQRKIRELALRAYEVADCLPAFVLGLCHVSDSVAKSGGSHYGRRIYCCSLDVDIRAAKTVGQAASEAFFVARFGSAGKPMVLVHGLGASHVHWLAVGSRLARRYRVLAPDLPGFGRTPLAGRDAGLEANARFIGTILDELDQPAILVGHSMGALIAMLVSTDRPEKVASLVLVTPPAPRPLRATFDTSLTLLFSAYCWPVLGEVSREIWVRARGPEGVVRHMFEVGCSSPSRVPAEVTRAALELARRREANGDDVHAFLAAYRSTWRFLANPFRFDRVVRSIAAPTLVIEGADDRLVPTIVTRRFRRLRQNWTFETLEGVGHMPHVELPAGFISKMTRWLNGATDADRKGSGSRTPLPDQPQSLEFLELRRS